MSLTSSLEREMLFADDAEAPWIVLRGRPPSSLGFSPDDARWQRFDPFCWIRLLILLAQYYLVAPRGLGQRYFPTWVTWVAGCWLNLGLPACNTRALRGGTSSEWHKTLPYINSRPWTLGCWQQLSRVSGSEAVSRLAHYDPQSSKGRCQELKLVLLCAKLVL